MIQQNWEMIQKIDAAFRAGDLEALRAAVEDPEIIPNGAMPLAIGPCLEYAIYHSPIEFVRTLLEMGADPNPSNHAGFPPVIAALTREPRLDVLRLLLEFGADPDQRGINDYTPLHMAVAGHNLAAVELLLEAGADPLLRTRIDDYETPRELARRAELAEIAKLLTAYEVRDE